MIWSRKKNGQNKMRRGRRQGGGGGGREEERERESYKQSSLAGCILGLKTIFF
jgi:hypothetical protein